MHGLGRAGGLQGRVGPVERLGQGLVVGVQQALRCGDERAEFWRLGRRPGSTRRHVGKSYSIQVVQLAKGQSRGTCSHRHEL